MAIEVTELVKCHKLIVILIGGVERHKARELTKQVRDLNAYTYTQGTVRMW